MQRILLLCLLFLFSAAACPQKSKKAKVVQKPKTEVRKGKPKTEVRKGKRKTVKKKTPEVQHSSKIQELQKEKSELQKTLDQSKSELSKTKKQVQTGQKDISYLGNQIKDRVEHIHRLEGEMDRLDSQIVDMQGNIVVINRKLSEKKAKLKSAIRYACSYRQKTTPLLFVLSANTLTQMYRRARYAREYVSYERNLGRQVQQKQSQLLDAQGKLLSSKTQKNDLLREVITQRKTLSDQQASTQKKVEGLKKKESDLAVQVNEQQKKLRALDKKIDDLIAYEIEQARKKAEAEERRLAAKNSDKSSKSSKAEDKMGASSSKGEEPAEESTPKRSSKGRSSWLTAQDRQLNGTFEQNKGRLPVPITGQYMLGNRFGIYNVPGLKHVQLENKGTNYIGKPGARARAVYDGEVTAVFQFGGTKNVLVRHGSYISVYCNLSSVIVSKGQRVKTKDLLGTVASDGDGNCVLHFQLRRETTKLNPEAWIAR